MASSAHPADVPLAPVQSGSPLKKWEQEVLAVEAEISELFLQISAAKVRLAYAKRRHRAEVLASLMETEGPIAPDEAQHILDTVPTTPPEHEARPGRPGVQHSRDIGGSSSRASGDVAPCRRVAVPDPKSLERPAKKRAVQPPGWCTACWRESRNPGKLPGVAHLWVHPCTKERPRKGRGRGRLSADSPHAPQEEQETVVASPADGIEEVAK